MIGQEILDSQIKADRFPFPSEGDITLAVHNANYTLGPVMLRAPHDEARRNYPGSSTQEYRRSTLHR